MCGHEENGAGVPDRDRCIACHAVLVPSSDEPGIGEANYGCGCDWTFTCRAHDPENLARGPVWSFCTEHQPRELTLAEMRREDKIAEIEFGLL